MTAAVPAAPAGVDEATAEAPRQAARTGAAPRESTQSMMQQYYGRVFPSEMFYRWLSYGHGGKGAACDVTFFKRREFCFTLPGDIFARYKSFQSGRELQSALKDKVPTKIDIGPVYSQDPAKRAAYKGDTSAGGFKPLERELVFDIDLTDYDDVRTSASGTGMSRKCWTLMHAAIQVMDEGLREDLGFEHVLWVYSGRRGVHCWVCDERARALTDEQRGAVVSFFAVYKGQEKSVPKLALSAEGRNHPSVERAYNVLLKYWDQVLVEQQLLTTERTRALMLQLLPEGESAAAWERALKALVAAAAEDDEMNSLLWQELKAQASQANKKKAAAWKSALQRIVFAFLYPRLDIEVSKKMNHLLKAPFCVHPKTGKVCVPIDPQRSSAFDPDAVPKIDTISQELEALGKGGGIPPSMRPHLEFFETAFLAPLEQASAAAVLRASRERQASSMEW